jgi:hypothetical protein
MKNIRNVLMLGLLAFFFAWYGFSWAYQSLYREPRQRLGGEIDKLKKEIEHGKNNADLMFQAVGQNQIYYFRSLPQIPNEASSQYSLWLFELLKHCDIEKSEVNDSNPTRTMFGLNYRFTVRGVCSFDQLSRFLFEFYYAPFLHRITVMSVIPVEGSEERITCSLTIDVLALRPPNPQAAYPSKNQLPTGYIPRLKSNDLTIYRVIADRNLLQAAKGGVDRADYTYLTAINAVDDQPEIWLTVRTDDSIVKAKQGDLIRIGSFRAEIVEISEQDVVFEREGMRWLVTLGDCLNQAFALPPEVFRNVK